jgi:lysophospholipid acyltransferase (LPLAT)-like uncharacterized protein
MTMLRAILGIVLGLVARVWLSTLRLRVEEHPALAAVRDRPWVFVFFHGTQWPLLAWKKRRETLVMVSLSADGAIQSRALSILGFEVVRGSTSRGGVRGLAALVRRLKRGGYDAAFAVDGPRGPYGVPKPGAVLAARAAGAVLVPMGSAGLGGKRFTRAWDRFLLLWPWARAAVVLGPPIPTESPPSGVRPEEACGDAIRDANDRAAAIVAGRADAVIPFGEGFRPDARAIE